MNGNQERIKEMQAAGWEFVIDQAKALKVGDGPGDRNNGIGSAVCQVVGTGAHGEPVNGFLMEIKQEWYDEDQQRKVAKLNDIDSAIRQGAVGPSSQDGGYVPDRGIDIT
ncbi:MAG: hypothetical protein HQL90_04235 [Magnetococcales bacterium]|nr:hypothetical protein [Magnetococcales bacterium]